MFQAKQIQAHMTRTGLIVHLFPLSRLLSFIALDENGDIHYANALFDRIPNPNVYIWNTIIRGCAKKSLFGKGFCYFVRMVNEFVEMDERSYVFGLKACGGLKDFRVGNSVHCRVWKLGFVEDFIVRNSLIHFYYERGDLISANKTFDDSEVKDVVSWTSMIAGNVKNGMVDDALKVFDEMCERGVDPNEITMVAIFSACARKGDLRLGERVREMAEARGVHFSMNMMNSMLDMYGKCGALKKAMEVFEKMELKDMFSWTSLINGHAKNGEVELAQQLFDNMPKRNAVSWSAMIGGYSQNNRPKKALELFYEMEKEGLHPMEGTLVSVLSACAQSGCMDAGQRIHDYYIKEKRVSLTVILGNAVIDMYAKCGSIDSAREMFNAMVEKDLVSYNSMISAYASHGDADKAIDLFEQMKSLGLKADDITFVGILSACAHGGLVEKGWGYFSEMESFRLTPAMAHYACMVDLFGRVGLLREAFDLIRSMAMEPDEAIWGALLNGCRMHANVELGKLAAEKLMVIDPEDSGTYMLLAGLCADKRRWSDVRMARSMMRDRGVKKTPGWSAIEVEGEFHEFFVEDGLHPESEAIYRVLGEILLFSKGDSVLDVCHLHMFP